MHIGSFPHITISSNANWQNPADTTQLLESAVIFATSECSIESWKITPCSLPLLSRIMMYFTRHIQIQWFVFSCDLLQRNHDNSPNDQYFAIHLVSTPHEVRHMSPKVSMTKLCIHRHHMTFVTMFQSYYCFRQQKRRTQLCSSFLQMADFSHQRQEQLLLP